MSDVARNFRSREYWIVQNRQYAEPSFRLRKCARMINSLAAGRSCSLLDVGCGPGALRQLLAPEIEYRGIDIAIHDFADYLREVDFAAKPIAFEGRKFDFVTTLGVLEYMGDRQRQKFREIHDLLKPGGRFILSYVNFGHFRRRIWPNYNNVQSIAEMKATLGEIFQIERCFPASHHWRPKQPGKNAMRPLQMHINFNIPVFSPLVAVEYFFVCILPTDLQEAPASAASTPAGVRQF